MLSFTPSPANTVNGVELTYDEIGNVLTYGNRSFTWNAGRNLEKIVDGDNEFSYTYDENGIRTSKTVNGSTVYYNTKDGVILSQKDDNIIMYFQYDNNGTPLGFIANEMQYFYLTNQMGDVVGLTTEDGNVVVRYFYDAWGNLIDIYATDLSNVIIALYNPIRYRGYYYDLETGYYYLQSRYYDPSICRFINADIPEVAQMSKDIPVGTNLFAYCSNDPVNNSDPSGEITIANAVGAVIGLLVGIVGGYFISQWIADKIGLKGAKRKIFIAGITTIITASSTAIGYFIGPYAVKLSQKIASYAVDLVTKGKLAISRISASIRNALKINSSISNYLIKNVSKLKYSKTAAKHLASRPYMNSSLIIREIIRSGKPIVDSSLKFGLKWVVRGSFGGKYGTYELVIDVASKMIVHFLFKK